MRNMMFHAALVSMVLATGCSRDVEPDQEVAEKSQASVAPTKAESQPVANSVSIPLEAIDVKLTEFAFLNVDAVAGVSSPKAGDVIRVSGEQLEIAGFAVDAVNSDVAAGVLVMIDAKPYVATYGGERPDIATALNNPKYLNSQFYLAVPVAELSKGLHTVKIRVVPKTRNGYHESEWSASIDVQ